MRSSLEVDCGLDEDLEWSKPCFTTVRVDASACKQLPAITSHFRPVTTVGEVIVQHWQQAALIKPSVLEPLLATIERKSLVLRTMGKLHEDDRRALRKALDEILGQP